MVTSTRSRALVRPWVLVAALILGLLATTFARPQVANAESGFVIGTVFRDFDSDGTADPGNPATGEQTDLGLAGVNVTAFDALNNPVGTAVSGPDGAYRMAIAPASAADGTPLRIEFDDAQRPGTANDLPGNYQSSFHGDDNGTSVQFVEAGDENVDFGVLDPEDFADNNAPIITGIQYAGRRTAPAAAELPAVVANPWVVTPNDPLGGQNTTFPGRVNLATYEQVGSVWGTAFNRSQNAAYAAATYKRTSDLGPLDIGGIYRMTNVINQSTGALNPTGTGEVEEWLDVEEIGVDVGNALSTIERGLDLPDDAVRDPDAFENSGKVGIGGIAITEDSSTLFFVNLFDRNVYALDIAGGAPTEATEIDLASELADGQRPWAVAIHRDRLYVGFVDTQGDGDTPGAAHTGEFQVLSTTVASAEDGSPEWRDELTGSLGYAKGNPITAWGNGNPSPVPAQVLRWNSWTDDWYWATTGSVGFNTGWGWTHVYPQPILSSLAFDADGFLVLGFLDRSSHQGGNRQWGSQPPPDCVAPCTGDSRYFETISSGDTLVAAPAGGAGGGFTLENNGSVGGRTGANTLAAQGPGGREFVNDR
ncbi:MAG TPA: hypothetical protein VIU87_25450, partial [Mycobacterium sp.]